MRRTIGVFQHSEKDLQLGFYGAWNLGGELEGTNVVSAFSVSEANIPPRWAWPLTQLRAVPRLITPGSQTYLSNHQVLIPPLLQDHLLILALLTASHLKLELERKEWHFRLVYTASWSSYRTKKDLKFICKSVHFPSGAPGLAAVLALSLQWVL